MNVPTRFLSFVTVCQGGITGTVLGGAVTGYYTSKIRNVKRKEIIHLSSE